jgi:hypothetical protein
LSPNVTSRPGGVAGVWQWTTMPVTFALLTFPVPFMTVHT